MANTEGAEFALDAAKTQLASTVRAASPDTTGLLRFATYTFHLLLTGQRCVDATFLPGKRRGREPLRPLRMRHPRVRQPVMCCWSKPGYSQYAHARLFLFVSKCLIKIIISLWVPGECTCGVYIWTNSEAVGFSVCTLMCLCVWLTAQPAGSCRCKEGFGGLRCDRWETRTDKERDRDTLWQVSRTFQLLSVSISVWKWPECLY